MQLHTKTTRSSVGTRPSSRAIRPATAARLPIRMGRNSVVAAAAPDDEVCSLFNSV